MTDCLSLFATCAPSLEGLLADELRAFDALEVRETRGGVYFAGDLGCAYRACLWSRVASRVLLVLGHGAAADADALYRSVRAVEWERHIDPRGTLAVDFSGRNAHITHTHFGALKVKDAVVDRLREVSGMRPDVDARNPDLRVNVHLKADEAQIAIDLSGEPLHRRGYRSEAGGAPLKENLAAAILLRAGWPELATAGRPFLDPMCGAGTLPIEAALIAADIAPGLGRGGYGFLGWRGHAPELWAQLVDEARARRATGLAQLPPIVGYDSDPQVVRIARQNIGRAELTGYVHVERRALADATPPEGPPGLVAVNPPYGERLGQKVALGSLYRELGSTLKSQFGDWRVAMLTAAPELGKYMGLRAQRYHNLYNGPLACRLLHFTVAPEWYVEGGPAQSEGARMFANRLAKNARHLARWARREGVECYRVYDADLPEYAFAIDLYRVHRPGSPAVHAHVQEYRPPAQIDADKARARREEALEVLVEVLEVAPTDIHVKVRERQKGAAQYQRQAAQGRFYEVHEAGLRFWVNLDEYLDTGLFLDHRITRGLLREAAAGRDFLNLFAYTATASVHAAAGGARSTTSVDLSRTYLDWAQRNLSLNGYTGEAHRVVQGDCLQWLRAAARAKARYGLIFLDPPTFSNSKRMRAEFDVQRDHVALIHAAAALLTPDGELVFSTNRRHFKLDAEALGAFDLADLSARTLPEDFKRNPHIHRCWRLRARG
ncbi:bifunctional 23S rRNA (guanine(2069)-N(7))-methyltransferase RlmK/23S rRNA (guanine(2445)-N(2))-methyltransferase RlmL [Ectothiorhodospiraceae bacterium 2226]|nr:bifunctional 23S rRNA (guanine(2069)-N(7))-methyltransferase RlmK/23S rRNA (guanine(2445)-N(2))-methyltransferase RlmL [Ectothiorhodospiraceae bacterium 2226]